MKKIFSLLSVLAIFMGITASAADFSDVPHSHWAYETISELADKNIINGISDGIYDPDGTLTRAQFIKLIVCALDDYDKNSAYAPIFDDTAETAWYTPYVSCGVYSGIVGRDADLFYPDNAITRGEAAVWMINGMGISSNSVCTFYDVTDAEQKSAVGTAAQYGLINGYDDGTFKPDNTLKRAEAAALISRMLKKSESFYSVREDSANEVVFKENVKYAESGAKNKITKIDNTKKTITFSNADEIIKSLVKDDILYIPECSGLPEGLIAKITNVKHNGSTVTITCTEPKLDEFIDTIDISTMVSATAEDFEKGNNVISSGTGSISNNIGAVSKSTSEATVQGGVSGDVKNGKLKWSANGIVTGNNTIHYETDTYATKNGAYAALDMKLDVLVDILISGENLGATSVFAHTNAMTETTAVFGYSQSASANQIFELPECEIPVAGPVKVGVTLYVVMSANGEFTVEATANLSTDTGMTYYNGEIETWNDPLVSTSAKADAEGSLEIGPGVEAEVKIDCGNDFFLEDLGLVAVTAEVGTGIDGYVDVEQSVSVDSNGTDYIGNQMQADENGVIHDCYACFYGDIYLYSQFTAGLADDLNMLVENYFGKEAILESPKHKATVTPWHFSIGGTAWKGPEFQLKSCQHKLYQTDISIIDAQTSQPVSGAILMIDDDSSVTADENGKIRLYLEKGSHKVSVSAEDYEDYEGSSYIYAKKNAIEIPIKEETKLTVRSSNIAVNDGTAYVIGRAASTLTALQIQPAKYDYICGIAFYNGRLYYSCKEAGTSDYNSAIYSCNPDGSDLKLIADCEWGSGYATHFIISGNKLYYSRSYTGACEKYYDIESGQILNTNIPNDYSLLYASGDNVYCAKYNKSGKNYTVHRINVQTGEMNQITSCKSIYDYSITPSNDGNVYYSLKKKIMHKGNDSDNVIYTSDSYLSGLHAVVDNYMYYSYMNGNYGYLGRLNLTTGQSEALDYHIAAGGGDAYFNW